MGGGAVCNSKMLAWESKIEKEVVTRKTERQEKIRLFCLRILIPHTWEQYPGWSVSSGYSWVADKAAAHRSKENAGLQRVSMLSPTVCFLQEVSLHSVFITSSCCWVGSLGVCRFCQTVDWQKGFYWWFVSTFKGVLLWSSNSKNSVPVLRNQEPRGNSGIDRRTR